MRKVISVVKFFALFLVFAFCCSTLCISVSAETYSRDYPVNASYNSGSPLWLHCRISTLGDVLIIIDPNTNIQSFGFDSPNGYNLINNTGSTIYGRCYVSGTSTGYNARWTSFYKLQLQTGSSNYGQQAYEDYNIYEIYGTTLDLIDYTSADRGNDYYDNDIPDNEYPIIVVSLLTFIALAFVAFKLIKPRVIRM